MKKMLNFTILLLASFAFTSCLTFSTPEEYANPKIDIPFEGQMDTRIGYEDLRWGMTYSEIKKDGKYPIIEKEYYKGNGYTGKRKVLGKVVKYNDGTTAYTSVCGHGEVNETRFYFTPDTNLLYEVVDYYLTTPSLEYLHSRYGDFEEKNYASESFKKEGGTLYANYGAVEGTGQASFLIYIYNNGKVRVSCFDYNADYTINKVPVFNSKNTPLQSGKWYCYSSTNGKKEAVEYTFINKSANGKYLFAGYSKNLKSPARSYLRAGFAWVIDTSGTYEIKNSGGLNKYEYDSADWKCRINDVRWVHTEEKTSSYRETINMFLNNEKLTVRHRDTVEEFNSAGLMEAFNNMGISWEELDYAISNEEF